MINLFTDVSNVMIGDVQQSEKPEGFVDCMKEPDKTIIHSMIPILMGITSVFGPNCGISLHINNNDSFPCVAVINGHLIDKNIGSNLSAFDMDIVRDESASKGKDFVGVYYTKTHSGHALKTVTNLIRNPDGEIIGCLCISIDLSVPLHEFIRSFIPVVDDNLANSLADPDESASPDDIPAFIDMLLDNEINATNGIRNLSSTEKNRSIVKELERRGIFQLRGSTNIVAEALGVSRYTIYNY